MRDQPEQPPRPVVRTGGEVLKGQRPADRRFRVGRPQQVQIPVPARPAPRLAPQPALALVYGFAGLIAVGSAILALPISSADGLWTPFLTALFTATSAVCVTGLVVVDTGTYWSGFGQAVILLLIQLGGFGFMTSSTLLLLLIGRRVTLRDRILLREAVRAGTLESIVSLVRRVFLFTIFAEGVGAVVLTLAFLRSAEAPQALWWGIFHAVSAFNNAGFDIFGGFRSLVPFNGHAIILLTVATLVISGGISYTVVADLVQRRRFPRLLLDTKLVLLTTVDLLILGTLGLLFAERANLGTLGELPLGQRLLNAFFMSASARTAGFNSVDTASLSENGLFLLMALMFVGGASGSTAGGIKVETFSLLLFAIISAVRGLEDVEAFRRRVPAATVLRAIAVALLALALVFVVSFALNATEGFSFARILFEVFSAFGTVGLSAGLTPDLSAAGRVILILTMFAGRLGPLTLVLALTARERRARYQWAEEAVKIG